MFLILSLLSIVACAESDSTEADCGTHASGESWTCDDGCNTCACEDGAIVSTLMACEEEVTCTDSTGTYTGKVVETEEGA